MLPNVEVEVKILPPIAPNEYLFAKHADKGSEKWEVFSWACRDLMAKVGAYGKHTIDYKERIMLHKFLNG